MAKKSKTQKAKASAARAAKKAEREVEAIEASEGEKPEADKVVEDGDKKSLLKKDSATDTKVEKPKAASKGSDIKKADKDKPKKKHFQFLREVRGELKRVTWPTKKDVGQWTAVVVAALVFFGAYVAILDNLVITPALIGVSSIELPESEDPNNTDSSADVASDSADASAASTEADSAEATDAAAEAQSTEGEQTDAASGETLSEEQAEVEAPGAAEDTESSQEG